MKKSFKWLGAILFALFWVSFISPPFADWLGGTSLNAPPAEGGINSSGALITAIIQSLFYVIGLGPVGYGFAGGFKEEEEEKEEE